jgi:hypothetical protein
MDKVEARNEDLMTRVKETGVLAKTASTSCGKLKKKVEGHEKKLAKL